MKSSRPDFGSIDARAALFHGRRAPIKAAVGRSDANEMYFESACPTCWDGFRRGGKRVARSHEQACLLIAPSR
jgi:hypothetical protein